MPNHCSNMLKVSGPEASLNRFKYTVLKKGDPKDGTYLDFEELAPLPITEDESWPIQVTTDAWGTKWNAYDASIGIVDNPQNEFLIYFSTAWSPPITAIISGSKLFPNLDFVLLYFEGGMGLGGIIHIKNGMEIYEIFHQGDEAAKGFYNLISSDPTLEQIDAWWILSGNPIGLKEHLIKILSPGKLTQWVDEIPPAPSIYRQYYLE